LHEKRCVLILHITQKENKKKKKTNKNNSSPLSLGKLLLSGKYTQTTPTHWGHTTKVKKIIITNSPQSQVKQFTDLWFLFSRRC
jgi:hypothetical protein